MLWYLTTRGGEGRGRTAQGFANVTVTWVIAQRISETRTKQRSGPATSWAAVQPRWGAMMKTTAHIVSIFTSPKQTFQVLSCIMSTTCMKANYRKQSCKTYIFSLHFHFDFTFGCQPYIVDGETLSLGLLAFLSWSSHFLQFKPNNLIKLQKNNISDTLLSRLTQCLTQSTQKA